MHAAAAGAGGGNAADRCAGSRRFHHPAVADDHIERGLPAAASCKHPPEMPGFKSPNEVRYSVRVGWKGSDLVPLKRPTSSCWESSATQVSGPKAGDSTDASGSRENQFKHITVWLRVSGGERKRTACLGGLDDLVALNHLAENNMLAVQPGCGDSAQEEPARHLTVSPISVMHHSFIHHTSGTAGSASSTSAREGRRKIDTCRLKQLHTLDEGV